MFEISKSLQQSFKDVEESGLSRGRELLEGFYKEIREADEEVVLGDLARYYASLFLGVGPENVSLCESAYRNERGLLFQNAYFDILEKYREVGLGKREDFPEPEDHLSLELAYMAHLQPSEHLLRWKAKGRRRKIEEIGNPKKLSQGAVLASQWIPGLPEGCGSQSLHIL